MSETNLPTLPTDLIPTELKAQADALGRATDARKIEKAAKGFEAVFLNKVFEGMERTIPKSGLLESGITKQVQGMFWYYLAQDMADKGGIGMWKDIQRQMLEQYSSPSGAGESQPTVEIKS